MTHRHIPWYKNPLLIIPALIATYPLTRPMFVIIKRDGGLSEKAEITYVNMLLSSEGQQIMKRAGLAPVHYAKK
jgi:ABC-type phosphate transport system substrate-binding protein